MTQDDYEALMERIDEVFEEVQLSRKAIEYLEDHTNDQGLMANLGMIRRHLSLTEVKLDDILGRPSLREVGPGRCPKCDRPMHRFHHCELNPVADPEL